MIQMIKSFFVSPVKVPQKPEDYLALYNDAKVVEANRAQLEVIVGRIKGNWPKYKTVSEKTGLPPHLIAGLHYRESNMNFYTFMHNGDPLFDAHGKPLLSVHVPRGKGPFATWEASAIDALGVHTNKDWSVGACLAYAERFNGLGYRTKALSGKAEYKQLLSPYVWSGTTHYRGGKYIADGVFSMKHFDKQMGVAAIFKVLGV